MNQSIFTLLLFLGCLGNLLGQVQRDVQKVLASKDFVAFEKFVSTLSNKAKGVSCSRECFRDLTPEYQEGVFFFERSVQHKENPRIGTIYTFRVILITTNTSIISYELSEEKNKKVMDRWEPYYVVLDKYKDELAFENLKLSFKRIFKSDLVESELFVTDFVYGSHCGIAGTDPRGRQIINYWVKVKNKKALIQWLKSTNTEKQIYAVDGLYQLKASGMQLTQEEMEMIRFVCNKNGTINTCSGCSGMHNEIKVIAHDLVR